MTGEFTPVRHAFRSTAPRISSSVERPMPSPKVLDIDRQVAELPIDEQRELLTRISRRVEHGDSTVALPVSLRGILAGQVPDDFDVDEALRDIRSGWKRKLGDAQS